MSNFFFFASFQRISLVQKHSIVDPIRLRPAVDVISAARNIEAEMIVSPKRLGIHNVSVTPAINVKVGF